MHFLKLSPPILARVVLCSLLLSLAVALPASASIPESEPMPTPSPMATASASIRDFCGCPEKTGCFTWPLKDPPIISAPYDRPSKPWMPGHRGVDLPSSENTPVYAPGSGKIIYAGTVVDRETVSIELECGLRLTLEPVTPAVRVGQNVLVGEPVGVTGTYQSDTATHSPDVLHWGAKLGAKDYVDPLALLYDKARLKQW